MAKLVGDVIDNGGNAIQGADVFIINADTESLVAVTSSDSSGAFSVTGLDDTKEYFAVAKYVDGDSNTYNTEGLPNLTPVPE